MEDLYVVEVQDGCVVVSANIIIDDMLVNENYEGSLVGVDMYRFPFGDDVARDAIVAAFHRWNNCTDLDAPSEFVLAEWVIG